MRSVGENEVPRSRAAVIGEVWTDDVGRTGPSLRTAALRDEARRFLGSPCEAASFAVIGVACTIAYSVLFTALRLLTGALESNAAALALTVSVNFAANRWTTFRRRQGSVVLDLAGYGLAYVVSVGVSTVALALILLLLDSPSRGVELVAGLGSGLLATATRYALLQRWVFGRSGSNGNLREAVSVSSPGER